jgi:hypothetical protein
MTKDNSNETSLKENLESVIETLDLPDLEKSFLRSRWLDQVLWMDGKSSETQKRYYILRLTAIIGGVIVPALISLNECGPWHDIIQWATAAISLVVAISVAVEEFFHYGERWRHYRNTVELLKMEGWKFFQRSGPYRGYGSLAEAYPLFAAHVEEKMKHELDAYITEVAKEKEEDRDKQ